MVDLANAFAFSRIICPRLSLVPKPGTATYLFVENREKLNVPVVSFIDKIAAVCAEERIVLF